MVPTFCNDIVLVSQDIPLAERMHGWLANTALKLTHLTGVNAPFTGAHDTLALALIDKRSISVAELQHAQELCKMDHFISPVPELLFDGKVDSAGARRNDWVHDQSAFRNKIAHWTGPLADPAFRSSESPYYRLIRMSGQDEADVLMEAFLAELQHYMTMASLDDPREVAHSLTGSAGMMGFQALSQAWSAVKRPQPQTLVNAMEETRVTIEKVQKFLVGRMS